ncbi:WxL domain-containing protein [Listeria booriae]|uniref:WxL domain-containing protein n=1 Tax=Listeria booriae TaxID=1552123 RepID=UPI001C8B40E9|nr:WxL domain-containing protein [Listeria booriae]
MDMKQIIVVGLATISAVIVSVGSGVHAAEVGSVTSDGKVKFIQQTSGDTNPSVNPLNPDQPLDPAEGDTPYPGTGGPLSIDYASSFDFGTQEISAETKTYHAKLDKVRVGGEEIEVPNSVQVTDNRGNNAGWHLTVAQNGQLEDESNRTLAGAEIELTKGTVVTKTGSDITPPTANQQIKLNPNGTAAIVMSAEEEQGMGKWVDKFGADNAAAADAITLTIPGKSAKYADSEYATTLTWTLSDTPE